MKIKEEECITLIVPHERREISFQYPAFKGTYVNIAEQIDKAGLKRPSSSETASLVYEAWKNPDEKYSKEIIQILKDNWFLEFTGNLYLPKSNEKINNGVILDLDPQNLKFDEKRRLIMDKDSLIKRLESNDPLVKFVSFEFKIGEQSLIEFQKNPYIQARYGEEGAEKITEVASKYKNSAFIQSYASVREKKARISSLGGCWYFDGGVRVDGFCWLSDRAFGVKK